MFVSPLVVELVGPAGVGKTALLRAIATLAPLVRTGVRIERVRQLPALVWSAIALTPAAVEMVFADPRWLGSGLRHLGRLRAFPAEMVRAGASGHEAILLDEGPVFSLGRLSVFHRSDTGHGTLARTWRNEMKRWSSALNGIVLLDARNDVLAERIRQRPKAHQVKSGSDRDVYDFLDRYRAAYRDIASRLTAGGEVQLVEFDTTTAPIEQVAADTLAALTTWGVHNPTPAYRGT